MNKISSTESQLLRERAVGIASYVQHHPIVAIAPLVLVALGIEVAQYWPEWFTGAHAFSELVRNIAYGLIGALVFAWILVEVPARRHRRMAYEYNKGAFEALLMIGPGMLQQYRAAQPSGAQAVDIWDRQSVSRCAHVIASTQPEFFYEQRRMVTNGIELVHLALQDIDRVQVFLDPDVAHAIGRFPGKTGIIRRLQVDNDGTGAMTPDRHAHITWELAEGARRLYVALRKSAPDVDFELGEVELADGTLLRNEEFDFVRE